MRERARVVCRGVVFFFAVMIVGLSYAQVQDVGSAGRSEPVVNIYPKNEQAQPAAGQGGVVVLEVLVQGWPVESVSAKALGVTVPFYPSADLSKWIGILGVDMKKEPGSYPVKISANLKSGRVWKKELNLTVITRDFGTQSLTLAEEELDDATVNRVKEDNRAFARLWYQIPSSKYFSGDFLRPVPGEKTSEFGVRRVINGTERSPHNGIDYHAAMGEPIKAMEAGKVVLVRECFYPGNAVVINHGAGLYSMYFHMSEFKVQEGDIVQRGQEIGLIGQTGRATGPHLHFGLRLLGAKIDPDALFAISPVLKEME